MNGTTTWATASSSHCTCAASITRRLQKRMQVVRTKGLSLLLPFPPTGSAKLHVTTEGTGIRSVFGFERTHLTSHATSTSVIPGMQARQGFHRHFAVPGSTITLLEFLAEKRFKPLPRKARRRSMSLTRPLRGCLFLGFFHK